VECLAIDRAVLNARQAASPMGQFGGLQAPPPREIKPPEWAPWTLMSAGAVVLLYSFTLPRRAGQP
jgi:hypothetical protein